MLERDYLRRGVAEFVGTFALVFVAAGGAAYARSPIDLALASGFVIAVMLSAFGFISGGHFNPAVTLGFLVTRRIAVPLAVLYWIVQLGAAVLAALLLKWVLPGGAISAANLGVPTVGSGVSSGVAVVVEAILTFFLMWVFFATTVDPRGSFQQIAGLAVGFTVSFWYVGPLAGAVIAAALYELLYLRPARPEPVGPPETGLEETGPGEAAVS
jgi:glycerol uptake facilitator-like aquaporin